MNYGGICTIDGTPAPTPENSFAQARLVEITPDNEIVFDMWIDGSADAEPMPLSSFRAEHVPNF